MAWDWYREGKEIGPFRVLTVIERADSRQRTRYRVRWRCCGAEIETTHAKIRERITGGTRVCRACVSKLLRERATGRRPFRDGAGEGPDPARPPSAVTVLLGRIAAARPESLRIAGERRPLIAAARLLERQGLAVVVGLADGGLRAVVTARGIEVLTQAGWRRE